MGDNSQNENHKYLGKFAILFLLSVLLIAVYTLILQKNYSESTLKAEVQRDSDCSDAIHKVITDKLTKEDFENINAKSDMKTDRYQKLQKNLNRAHLISHTLGHPLKKR